MLDAVSPLQFSPIKGQIPSRRRNLLQANSSSLYRTCIRTVCRNIEYYNRRFDLTHLPWNIKTDLIYLNMKLNGFPNEESFMRLLTSHVKTLVFNRTALTDAMLLRIAEHCPDLQELMISSSNCHFTRAGLCKSIKFLKNLQVLQIGGTMEIDNRVIAIINANCGKLKSLWITDCPNVDDGCAESLESRPLLELNLANTKITDVFLQTLKDSILMEHLRDISLRNCSITMKGLTHLNWLRLENINIMGAPVDDLSFIPSNAVYKTLNWSI